MTDRDRATSTRTWNPASRRRRGVAVGLAGGLLAGTAAGLVVGVPGLTSAGSEVPMNPVLVEQGDETDNTTPPTVDDTESPDWSAERGDRIREVLDDLVDDGTITAEQADAVVAKLVEAMPERGDRGDHGPGGRFGRGAGVVSEVITDLLGLDARDVRRQLRDGATLAEIANSQGVEPQAVVDELVGELAERLDNAVENGRIDRATADARLASATERITDLVNNGHPGRHDRPTGDEPLEEAPPTTDD